MQRLLRKVGKLSSKSKHEAGVCESRAIIPPSAPTSTALDPAGAQEAKSPAPPSSSCVAYANGTTRKCQEIPSTGASSSPSPSFPSHSSSPASSENLISSKLSQPKKKRNSLIESFRKLKRHSRSKDPRRPVAGISETVLPSVKEEITPEVVPTACEGEPAGEDQCPSTREVSVNGDVTSLSLSVLTLRSLGSAEASAGHAFSRLDTSSEVVESVSSDAGRAEFLAKEVPGLVAHATDTESQLSSMSGNIADNQVSSEYNGISISPHPVTARHNDDPPLPVLLSLENPVELCSSSMFNTECAVQLSNRLSTHVFTGTKVVERGDGDDDDDLNEDGSRIHDTLPVDLFYYSPIELGNEWSRADDTFRSSDKVVASSKMSALALTDQEDYSSSGAGRWSLMYELTQLSRHGWYWGPISREEAEEKLTDQPEGAFLIRDSTDERYLFSLSFRSFNRTLHTRIEYCNGEFSFYHLPHSEGYRSLIDLIENAIHDSLNGIFYYSRSNVAGSHSYAVKLTKPVSRFTQVRSLQYLCRFIIRQHTRVDHIQNLPLPVTVKSWLRENQY